MKIAVCLFGQPRTAKIAAQGILQYIESKHTVDYYIHTWVEDSSFAVEKWEERVYDRETLKQQLVDLYNPVAIKVEDFREVQGLQTPWRNPIVSQNEKHVKLYGYSSPGLYQSYSFSEVLRLCPEMEYDWIVCMRIDSYIGKGTHLNTDKLYLGDKRCSGKVIYSTSDIVYSRLGEWLLFDVEYVISPRAALILSRRFFDFNYIRYGDGAQTYQQLNGMDSTEMFLEASIIPFCSYWGIGIYCRNNILGGTSYRDSPDPVGDTAAIFHSPWIRFQDILYGDDIQQIGEVRQFLNRMGSEGKHTSTPEQLFEKYKQWLDAKKN